jgi:hypothetical protein
MQYMQYMQTGPCSVAAAEIHRKNTWGVLDDSNKGREGVWSASQQKHQA